MLFSLSDLVKPLTRQQVQDSIYDVLSVVGVSTTSWWAGAPLRTMIVGTSIIGSSFSTLLAEIAKSGFLELASGKWLSLCAWYVYRVERQEPTFASGNVTLTNTGGGVYEVEPDDLIFSNPSTGKTYRNTTSFTLSGSSTITIPVVAVEAGSASTSPPGTIVDMEIPLLGVSCSNSLALVGQDEETDPSLRTRCYEKLGSLSPNGPSDAYSFIARNSMRADGSRIGISRVKITRDGAGGVGIVVATATGGISGTVGNPATDLGAIQFAVASQAAPLSVTPTVSSASPVPVDLTYALWVFDDLGLTDAQLTEQVATRLSTYIAGQPIGGNVLPPATGKVFLSALSAVIGSTRPEIFRIQIATPSVDPEFTETQVPVVGTLTCSGVNRISREVVSQ